MQRYDSRLPRGTSQKAIYQTLPSQNRLSVAHSYRIQRQPQKVAAYHASIPITGNDVFRGNEQEEKLIPGFFYEDDEVTVRRPEEFKLWTSLLPAELGQWTDEQYSNCEELIDHINH